MKLTSITIKKINRENSRLRGIASVLIDDAFIVHNIRIINGDNGLFIAMPSEKTVTGEYKDICHPVNSDIRTMFTNAILDEYNKEDEQNE